MTLEDSIKEIGVIRPGDTLALIFNEEPDANTLKDIGERLPALLPEGTKYVMFPGDKIELKIIRGEAPDNCCGGACGGCEG